tara:strand:- start:106 stop:345 length:240 start_codon:yes stop_codon:yes gene_type:complete
MTACSSGIKLVDVDATKKSYSYECSLSEATCISNMVNHCDNSDINIIESSTVRKKSMDTTGGGGITYISSYVFECVGEL